MAKGTGTRLLGPGLGGLARLLNLLREGPMGDYTVLIATFRVLELQKTAHLVLRRFITPPAHDTKARTGFAET